MNKYSIGIDFGTLSGRSILVNNRTGEEIAVSIMEYPHAVMDTMLPSGKKLGYEWALQHPQDYLDVLSFTVSDVIKQSGVSADDIVGVGIDFTACSVLPIKSDGTPLCFLEKYKDEPHAYVKLWKHHAAQDHANRLNDLAHKRGEAFIKRYGGKISSEWMFPKIMQIVEEAPEIYSDMDKFIEAADWIVLKLTGVEARNSCTAGYKGIWHKRDGYPSKEFLKELHPMLENFVEDKLSDDIYPIGSKAGEINEYASKLTGLKVGTAVAVGNIDAHVSAPAVGLTKAGQMLMIMGTSTCHVFLGDVEKNVPGMCGVVEDGILSGFYGYEAGQSCVGDHFDWFVKNCVPSQYYEVAKSKNMGIHQYLTELANAKKVGETGLLALDWWNGNRSVLVDVALNGMILGMNLQTKPEDIYRALIEATAYGTRMIIDTFEENGVSISELFACGGIAEKNAMLMQIYADVTNRTIKIGGSPQSPALGSAIFGAVAAGKERGGYDSMVEATEKMANLKDIIYTPIKANVDVYNKLYNEYKILHDYFGRGENDVMKRLRDIKASV